MLPVGRARDQRGPGTLHDCLVGRLEARLRADARDARITQISACCNQEPCFPHSAYRREFAI